MNETNIDDTNEITEDGVEQVASPVEISSEAGESETPPDEDNEVVVSIGEETPPEREEAPGWVRDLRRSHRELQKKNRELENRLRTVSVPTETLKPKPTLEDHDYDADAYEVALLDWVDRKKKIDADERARLKEQEDQEKAWQDKLTGYAKAKTSLRVKDYEDAEAAVQEAFNITQQGVMIAGAEQPALITYALGKNPKKLQELASIKDPVKFAFAISKVEAQLKVTDRRAPPPPERIPNGTARGGGSDSQLEKLRSEAERTGDYSKVFKYKKQKGL